MKNLVNDLFNNLIQVWKYFEPLVSLVSLDLLGYIFLVITFVWGFLRKNSPSKPNEKQPLPEYTVTVTNSDFQSTLRTISDIVENHNKFICLTHDTVKRLQELTENIDTNTLRLYVFGMQNAGKSSFINAVLKDNLSPASSGKCTACLVRIRHSTKTDVKVRWSEKKEEYIALPALRDRMQKWASYEERPQEVVINTSQKIFGTTNTEIVDTPGTGSANISGFDYNLEEAIVHEASRCASAAILVYRWDHSDMEAHENLLRRLRDEGTPIIAICNLDPNWKSKYQENPSEVKKVVGCAEKKLRTLGADCLKIAVDGGRQLQEFSFKKGGGTIADAEERVKMLLKDSDTHIRSYKIKLIKGVLGDLYDATGVIINDNKPQIEKLKSELDLLEKEIEKTQQFLLRINQVTSKNDGAVTGFGVGATVGAVASIIATIATGGIALPLILGGTAMGAGVGGVLGSNSDENDIADAYNKLYMQCEKLDEIANSCNLSKNIIHRNTESLDYFLLTIRNNFKESEPVKATQLANQIEQQLRSLPSSFQP